MTSDVGCLDTFSLFSPLHRDSFFSLPRICIAPFIHNPLRAFTSPVFPSTPFIAGFVFLIFPVRPLDNSRHAIQIPPFMHCFRRYDPHKIAQPPSLSSPLLHSSPNLVHVFPKRRYPSIDIRGEVSSSTILVPRITSIPSKVPTNPVQTGH